jgi:hypothetical protein
VLRDYAGSWRITTSAQEYHAHQGIKIWYSQEQSEVGQGIFIQQHALAEKLLHSQGMVSEIEPTVFSIWHKMHVTYNTACTFGFDIFSATFYMLARVEEYATGNRKDVHGRFSAKQCDRHTNNLFRKPLVDEWIIHFQKMIMQADPTVTFNQSKFQFISTIDVDSAYAYKHKGWQRTLGGIAKDIVNLNIKNLANRLAALAVGKPDAYDTYAYINQAHQTFGVSSKFFFLLANFGKMDKNVPHTSQALQQLIKSQQNLGEVGIHPGVASNGDIKLLETEKQRLENITGTKCTSSRQHYLMLHMPQTYRDLIKCGIRHDYTMGFHDNVGFRAGTCRPFLWFDLLSNEITELTLHPFAAMDITLNSYLKLSAQEAIDLTAQLIDEVRNVQGTYIALWHNETLTDSGPWKGWRKVWEEAMRYTTS